MNTEFERIQKIADDALRAKVAGDEISFEYLLWMYQEEVNKLSPATLIAFREWNANNLKELINGKSNNPV